MSRVRRLSIVGVRNFGDEKEEEIRFTRPLTLIIGQNGVGKTTIIEALRYASTGEFPPGSDRGKGFIHDPMLKKSQTNVRGKVKAEFVDKGGETTTVTRVMEATRTESMIKFKTVDSTISKINKTTKQEYAITHRCTDVDKEIKASLGLSSAILNYVIFCHQDDANWPTTDDGKKLKERFDEIFDTTRYNRALEQLRKIVKGKQSTIRHLNAEINALAIIVEEVKAKEIKLKDYQHRRMESMLGIEATVEKLEPLKRQINDINNLEKRYTDLTMEKNQKGIELYLAEQELRALESAIKEFFSGADSELTRALKSYDDDLEDKMEKINQVGSELQDFADKENKISKNIGEQKIRVGTFKQQMEDQKRKTEERNNILNEILKEWNMETIESQTTEGFIRSLIEDVDYNYQAMEKSLSDTRTKYDKEENELEKNIEGLRNNRTKIDVELKRCEKEASDAKDSIRDTKDKIVQADEAERKLNAVDKKLEDSNKLIQRLSNEIVDKNYSEKIDLKMKMLENIEEEFSKADELIVLLQNQNTLKTKYETLKTELSRKHQEIEGFKKKHGQQLEDLLGKNEIPKNNLKNAVSKLQAISTDRLNKLRQEVSQEQNKATSLQTTIEHLRKEFRTKLAETQCDKSKVAVHCNDYKNYEHALLSSNRKLKSLQNKRGMFAYQGAAYSEYVKKLSDSQPCCPLCERDFSKPSDAAKIVSKLNDDLKNHPERLKSCEDELNQVKSNHESLLALKTIVEKILKFEEVDKQETIKRIEENQTKLKISKKNIDDIQTLISELEKQIEACNNLSGYLAVWDQCLNDIERLETNYNQVSIEIDNANFCDGKTMEDVRNEREMLKQNKKEAQDQIASLRKELDLQNEEMKRAKDSKARILEEQLNIHNEVQKVKQWRENLAQLSKKEMELKNTIQLLRQQLITAEEELDTGLQELEDLKSKHREELDKQRKKLMEYSKQIDKLNVLQVEVVSFQAKKIESRLKEVQNEMNDNEKILGEIKAKSTKYKQELSELKENISSYELRKRNLSDNLKYRQYKSKIKNLKESNEQIAQEIQELDIEGAKKDLDFLKRKAEKLEKEVNIARGSEKELNYNISQLEDELQREEYCTARNKYQSKWLEKMVTEDAILDLQVYSKALDLAMTNYHEERMNSVNKSMKNLWNLIYTGTDTTSIQIRTDATTEAKSRRQFNYKLVQIKHGVEMDMKGRCSAGQRVLASIVIRLALAETFCEQCGMLALDEPTTNLDASNAANLADTLYNYVSLRAAYQKSFQLIVITHDEQFIHKLSQLNKNGGFYELYRTNEGLTSIQYLSIDAENQRRRRLDENDKSDDENAANNAVKAPIKKKENNPPHKKRAVSTTAASSSNPNKPFTFDL